MPTKVAKTKKSKPRARIQDVPLRSIVCDPRCQTRDGLDETHIEGMLGDLNDAQGAGELSGEKPVTFFDSRERKFYLGDGFHRFEAYRRAGRKSMPCEVRKGTIEDAIEYAHRDANATNSLKLGVAAVKKKIQWHLANEKYRHFADIQIARWCHCSQPFVTRTRDSQPQPPASSVPPQWLSDPKLKQAWSRVVDQGGIPRLTLKKDDPTKISVINVASIGKSQQPAISEPPPNADDTFESPEPSHATQLDRIRAKIRKYKDMPEDRADRMIAAEEVVSTEVVQNVRKYDALSPPKAKPSTPPEDESETSPNDDQDEEVAGDNDEHDEEPQVDAKRTEGPSKPKTPSREANANGRSNPVAGRGLNKGQSCIEEKQIAHYREQLVAIREYLESWFKWNPWLGYNLMMRGALYGFREEAEAMKVVDNLARFLADSNPDEVCPACGGHGCMACHSSGFMPENELVVWEAANRSGGRK